MKTRTKGNVIVEEIKIGDIHYEYFYGQELKVEVISIPTKTERDDDNYYEWQSKTDDGKIINYGVSDKFPHYAPNLYNYQAYKKF